MADATDDRIRELKIMVRLIEIEAVYTFTRPGMNVLDNVHLYDLYLNGIGSMTMV